MDVSEHKLVLTRKGYDELQHELDEINKVKRPAVVERIKNALAAGDLRENFDYHDSKRQQGLLEMRANQLKTILNTATVVECTGENGCIGIGSKVVVKDIEEGFEDEYTIVGSAEADASAGKISYESSMGAELLDKKAGEVITVQSPGGEFQYEIMSVE